MDFGWLNLGFFIREALIGQNRHFIIVTFLFYLQDVRLMTLTITDGQKLEYKPGDVFNIRPRNSKEDIEDLFGIFETHGIDIKPHYRLLVEEYHQGK